jgi:hypothetical protein
VSWHVIAQIGDDSYYPALDANELRFIATIDKPGDKHGVTHDLLSDVFKAGLHPSSVAIDLLNVASIVYTADLRIWRGYDGEDAWFRKITLHIPVSDVELWAAAGPKLTELLSFLTGDEWIVNFRKNSDSPEPVIGDAP